MKKFQIQLARYDDDPLALRASVGGGETVGGYYLTYRGDPEKILRMLKAVTAALEAAPPEMRQIISGHPASEAITPKSRFPNN